MTEHEIQVEVFRWLDQVALVDERFRAAFAIPNAARRSWRLAQYLRAEGLRSGVPDVFVAIPTPQFAGLFLELKAGKGRVSEDQEVWIERLRGLGYCVEVCRSLEGAQEVIEDYVRGASATP